MAQLNTLTGNYSATSVALVLKTVQEKLRANLYAFTAKGSIIPAANIEMSGHNDVFRSVAYGDLTAGGQASIEDGQATPTAESLAINYVEFTGTEYGRLVSVSDTAMRRSPHNLSAVAADAVARDILQAINDTASTAYKNGTSVLYPGTNVANGTIQYSDVLNAKLVKVAVATLGRQNVLPISGPCYVGAIDPGVTLDLESDTDVGGWIDGSRYGSPEQLQNGLLGRYAGVDFIKTTAAIKLAGAGASGTDLYQTTIIGKDSLFLGDLSTLKVMIEQPGGHDDPLQRSLLVGWKGVLGAALNTIQSARYVNINTAASI
jgi:N4-gp56 family major capsid protein